MQTAREEIRVVERAAPRPCCVVEPAGPPVPAEIIAVRNPAGTLAGMTLAAVLLAAVLVAFFRLMDGLSF
jgi:hypothetical protein